MLRNYATRTRSIFSLVALLAIGANLLSGCDVALLFAGDDHWDWGMSSDPSLLAVITPDGDSMLELGDTLTIAWVGTLSAESVAIDLHHEGQWLQTIDAAAANTGEYWFPIPGNLDTSGGADNTYQVTVRGRHLKHAPGDLEVIAYSESFTITPVSDGLTDVTVNQRLVVITVIDNGSEIDGDTVDIILNGVPVVSGHVLVASPGSNFGLTLGQGDNLLEILAINEGSVSPNTAQLLISNVTAGQSSQEWRLFAGETGTLNITAP